MLEAKAGMEEGQGPHDPLHTSLPSAGPVWYFFCVAPGAIKNKEPTRDKGSAFDTALESQKRAVTHCALQLESHTKVGREESGGRWEGER